MFSGLGCFSIRFRALLAPKPAWECVTEIVLQLVTTQAPACVQPSQPTFLELISKGKLTIKNFLEFQRKLQHDVLKLEVMFLDFRTLSIMYLKL